MGSVRSGSRGRRHRSGARQGRGVGGGGDLGGGVGRELGVDISQEIVPAEAGIPVAALRVEDPESRSPPRLAVAVAGDQRLRALPDDIATEVDPRASCELQAKTGRFGDGAGQIATQPGRLQHHEERLRPPSERRQATEPVGDAGRPIRGGKTTAGQVQNEQIHRAPRQQDATDGQALIEGLGGDDDQPFEPDAAGDGLDWIEAPPEIEPGHDGTRDLGLRGEPENEGGPAAGAVAADRNTGRSWQAARSQDGVERREPGPDDAVVGGRARGRGR